MKILLINSVHYTRGGADIVYFETGKLLEEYGHEVFYFSSKGEKTFEDDNLNYFYPEINFKKLSFLSKISNVKNFIYNDTSYKNLLEYVDRVKPDVAHVHLFMGGGTVSILKALNERGVPIVHSAHDYRLICPAAVLLDKNNNICELCKDGFYFRSTIRNCSLTKSYSSSFMLSMDAYFREIYLSPLNLINHIIFVSNFSKAKHIEFNDKYALKSSVIYNFSKNLKSIKKHSFIRGDYFIYFGRLSREKGLSTLIESACKININLKIVGDGPLYNEYKKLNYNNIEFLGFKQGRKLSELVLNSSFVIVPSEVYENNPLTIIESYFLGKPVIGSRIGGIPEIVEDGDTGYLFETKSLKDLTKKIKFSKTITDKEYLRLSNNAMKFAKMNFDSKKHYTQLIEIYKSLV